MRQISPKSHSNTFEKQEDILKIQFVSVLLNKDYVIPQMNVYEDTEAITYQDFTSRLHAHLSLNE